MRRIAWLLVIGWMLAAIGCQPHGDEISIEMRAVEERPGEGLTEMAMSGWGVVDTFYVGGEALLNTAHIDSAAVVPWRGQSAVEILLNEAGRERFAQVTADNIGRRLGMLVNGRLVCAPVVRDTIPGGRAMLTGDFSEEEARRIVESLARH